MDVPLRPSHYSDLEAVEAAAWAEMASGATQRKHAFHQATVANVGPDGEPQARTVVLRGAREGERRLRFHTDSRSGKLETFRDRPRCVVHFYDHDAKIQVRVDGHALAHHTDALARAVWSPMRAMSKECYRQPIGPGTLLDAPDGAEGALLGDEEAFQNFVVVEVEVLAFEWLYLAAAGHRRARVRYADGVERTWLAP
ncbi:MAG: pyridoxamine 5'-phosphate oxidase family protein [Pseudomonadota bacterium]